MVAECEVSLRLQNAGKMPVLDDVVSEDEGDSYKVSPFQLEARAKTISIGEAYQGVEIDDFASFMLGIFRGGINGWGQGKAIPPSVIQGFGVIKHATSKLQ